MPWGWTPELHIPTLYTRLSSSSSHHRTLSCTPQLQADQHGDKLSSVWTLRQKREQGWELLGWILDKAVQGGLVLV